MSDEISDERAEEMAARFERMEPTGTARVTPLGELYLAVLKFRNHSPDGYDQAMVAVRAAFREADESSGVRLGALAEAMPERSEGIVPRYLYPEWLAMLKNADRMSDAFAAKVEAWETAEHDGTVTFTIHKPPPEAEDTA